MGIADLTDDELRHQLFERLYARLQAEQHKDPAVLLFNRTPIAFWSSRHGSLLTVDQDAPGRLVRITVEWRQRPNGHSPEEHWTASVFRTADGTRVALVGGVEGTIEAVVDGVVKTFLEGTQQGE